MATATGYIDYTNAQNQPTRETILFSPSPSPLVTNLTFIKPSEVTPLTWAVNANPEGYSSVFHDMFKLAPPESSSTSSPISTSQSTPKITQATSSKSATSRSKNNASVPQSTITASTSPRPSSASDSLSNGVVAGIVIGAAIGLSVLTFLITCLCMRRRQKSGGRSSNHPGSFVMGSAAAPVAHNGTAGQGGSKAKSGTANVKELATIPAHAADDNTIRAKARTLMDQAELFVENFYLDTASPRSQPNAEAVSAFNSPYLPSDLEHMLMRSRQASHVIKHVLAYSTFHRITTSARTEATLLPPEYALAPTTTLGGVGANTEMVRSFAQWRNLTAFLRPDAPSRSDYVVQRDARIEKLGKDFVDVFAPWANSKYTEQERRKSLSAILKEAAEFGIFIFQQPSQINFQWPSTNRLGSKRIAVLPALEKVTDEKGNSLVTTQVLVEPSIKEI